jgi:hypothetical protein
MLGKTSQTRRGKSQTKGETLGNFEFFEREKGIYRGKIHKKTI